MSPEPFAAFDDYDAVGLARLVATGDVGPVDLVETVIGRIEDTNPSINAVIATDYEAAGPPEGGPAAYSVGCVSRSWRAGRSGSTGSGSR